MKKKDGNFIGLSEGQPVPCVDEFEYEIVFEKENPGKIKKYFKD